MMKGFLVASGRTRTGDPRIFSALLYQLSYRGLKHERIIGLDLTSCQAPYMLNHANWFGFFGFFPIMPQFDQRF